jgi:hypothetical protein
MMTSKAGCPGTGAHAIWWADRKGQGNVDSVLCSDGTVNVIRDWLTLGVHVFDYVERCLRTIALLHVRKRSTHPTPQARTLSVDLTQPCPRSAGESHWVHEVLWRLVQQSVREQLEDPLYVIDVAAHMSDEAQYVSALFRRPTHWHPCFQPRSMRQPVLAPSRRAGWNGLTAVLGANGNLDGKLIDCVKHFKMDAAHRLVSGCVTAAPTHARTFLD